LTASLHSLRSLTDSVNSLTIVTAKDLRCYSHEFRHRIRLMKLHVPAKLWQGLLAWGRLGRFNARLIIRKPKMVQAWKQHLAAIARVITEKMNELEQISKRFWVQFTRLADDARRQVKSGYDSNSGEALRGKSFKVLASGRPRGLGHGDFGSDHDGFQLDKLRSWFWKLKNGDLHPAIMITA